MSSLDERLRQASTETRSLAAQAQPPTERALRRRSRERAAWWSMAAVVLLLLPVALLAANRASGPSISTDGQDPSPAAVTSPDGSASVPPIEWSTPQVSFQARQLVVETGATTYDPNHSTPTVRSDPGTPDSYTTLEASWDENDTEMRLNIYFTSDGIDWWSNEIRVYNGQAQGDWVTFTGDFFRTPLGQPYRGDLRLEGEGHEGAPVVLRVDGLELQAFLPPQGCNAGPGLFSIEVLYPTIEMSAAPNTGFATGVRLLDGNCNEVNDYSAYTFDWVVGDPEMIAIGLDNCTDCTPQRVELTASQPGRTELTVTVTPKNSATPVATGTMAIVVE